MGAVVVPVRRERDRFRPDAGGPSKPAAPPYCHMWVIWTLIAQAARVTSRPVDDADDRAALARMAQGDASGLAAFYDRYARAVYSLALRILGNQGDAEDIVQEVFSQAWRQAARYDPTKGAAAAWLLMLARSRSIDRLRAIRVRPAEVVEDGPTDVNQIVYGGPAPDAQVMSSDEQARVRLALERLPLLQRAALELAYYEGLTHVEIAARLEEPLGTVKTRIRNGLVRLRELLTAGTS